MKNEAKHHHRGHIWIQDCNQILGYQGSQQIKNTSLKLLKPNKNTSLNNKTKLKHVHIIKTAYKQKTKQPLTEDDNRRGQVGHFGESFSEFLEDDSCGLVDP